ncbi:potassium transporter [Pyricularia oryzae 70-15]|uniref:Potassium transporter n=1 Tax=Pyricularia oryzae (strain 70-15 / ATCC MYA-4617 / FGSC 8958) TaxID=242507 RepID=G4N084_PYRO7|nr:potassium transporter [Pyricularia oryzae 70-15]EHA51422.1 potassium transporter [Pyricularia oryzae 70-15]KAI7913689.1 potassium transporter [Pyricularia oryzae]
MVKLIGAIGAWRPKLDFIALHYIWIIFCAILGFIVLYPHGNVPAIDALFFGASASTESGLNTIDLKELKMYQQLYLYVIPMITNLGFINPFVVAVRIYWFRKKLKQMRPSISRPDPEAVVLALRGHEDAKPRQEEPRPRSPSLDLAVEDEEDDEKKTRLDGKPIGPEAPDTTYFIPPPRERDSGQPFVVVDPRNDDEIRPAPAEHMDSEAGVRLRRPMTARDGPALTTARSLQHAASSVFVLGPNKAGRRNSVSSRAPATSNLPALSRQVTVGRNSKFYNLTPEDEEKLGGIEYRALKVLLKVTIAYFFGLHLLGIVCLVPWIHNAPAKYTDWLAQNGLDKTWWGFYSAQTMVDNLGFTLTPDSMVTFRDATWPMLIMTFLAFAGNTLYPVLLRLTIYVMSKVVPARSSTKEALQFLLDHPRRCYTLLFPSGPTWVLFVIIAALNLIDVVLIIVLDLDNPAINDLPMGPRVLSALFQAASSRHTGTSTLNLALINPAVQFSLLVMMYIAILPIAISIRASNTYEEKSLGMYKDQELPDESDASSYVVMHFRNQLSFDLWYIFLGTFCICVAESQKISDPAEPAFSVFSIFFECVSAYGTVGLSLGHPSVSASLSSQFGIFGKLVICAAMIRGRHRTLPYAIDRAIMLPGEGSDDGTGPQGDALLRGATARSEKEATD